MTVTAGTRATNLELPAIAGGTPIRPADRFLVFGQPDLGEDEIAAVTECLRSRWIGTGPRTNTFEQAFAAYVGVPDAVALNSCTAALHLSLLCAGIGPGDEVIGSTMTFCSSVNVILHAGATPVLADCDAHSLNITAEEIERRITPKTKAVIITHMTGRPCEMDAIVAVTRSRGLVLIEDCAHAVGTTSHGRHAGTFGDYGCFSFYATKNITTAEGGMLIAADPKRLETARKLSLHGLDHDAWNCYSSSGFRFYETVTPGFKYNMTDVAASIGQVQLAMIGPRQKRRDAIWQRYRDGLSGLPFDGPLDPASNTVHARHLYTPMVRAHAGIDRNALLSALHAENIGTGAFHPSSLPLLLP